MSETLNEALVRHGFGAERVACRLGAYLALTRGGERVGPMDAGTGWCLVALLDGRPMPPAAAGALRVRARQLLKGLRALDAAKAAEGEP